MKSILFIVLAILGIIAESKAQNIPNYIPTNGLVCWWPFNGNANDESLNGNNGNNTNSILTTNRFGDSNSAYYFNGNSRIENNNNSLRQLVDGVNPFTVTLWFNRDSSGNTGGAASLQAKCLWAFDGNNTSPYKRVWATIGQLNDSTTQIQFTRTNTITGSPEVVYNTNDFISSNSWHFLGITYNGNSAIIYLDNTPLTSIFMGDPVMPNSILGPDNSITGFTIGDNNQNNLSNFSGIIDDIGIWNRALSAQEITALYTASSTNNNVTSNTTANVPDAISYQAVARDAQGMPLANANLQVQFTLIADSLSGTAEYEETHTLSTNSLGLFTTAFGAGTPVNNTFGNINWTDGNKFVNVQIDAGNGWIDMGTQQLLSTPYSMHSATSGAIKNPGLPIFADNAAALAGGLVAGDMYRTASGDLKIVY